MKKASTRRSGAITMVMIAALMLCGLPASIMGTARALAAPAGSKNAVHSRIQPRSVTTQTLYDQTSGASTTTGTGSDTYTDLPADNNQAADDFTVPAGVTWTISEVDTLGAFNLNGNCGSNPPSSVNVYIYADNGGLPADSPSFSYTDLTPTGGMSNPNFDIPITPTQLSAGTWWVSVQVNDTCSSQNQWFWMDRAPQAGNPAAWIQPGNGYGTGCTTWTVRTSCPYASAGGYNTPSDTAKPDQAFKLLGTSTLPTAKTPCTGTICPTAVSRFHLGTVSVVFKAKGSASNPFAALYYVDTSVAGMTMPSCGSSTCTMTVSSMTCSGHAMTLYGTWTNQGMVHDYKIILSGTGTSTGSFTLLTTTSTGASYSKTSTGSGIVSVTCPV